MEKRSRILYVTAFLLAIVLSAIYLCGFILSAPSCAGTGAYGNLTGNTVNGGGVLYDAGRLFYTRQGVLYASSGDGEPTRIADGCDGWIQLLGDDILYLSGGSVIRCGLDGKNAETLIENAAEPLVFGGGIYYLSGASIHKYILKYGEAADLGIRPEGGFIVYFNRLYFCDGGKIMSAALDGSDRREFAKASAERFVMDNNNLFYLSGGGIYGMPLIGISSGDDHQPQKLVDGEMFYVNSSENTMIYGTADAVYYCDLAKTDKEGKLISVKLADGRAQGVYGSEENFYYQTENGLFAVSTDGRDLGKVG